MGSRWLLGVLVSLLVIFGALHFYAGSAGSVGGIAPSFSVVLVENPATSITQASAKGKPMVIDFWATWCQPCVESLPDVRQLASDYRGKVFFLGVTDEARSDVVRFLSQSASDYPIGIDLNQKMNRAYKITAFPTMVIIGSNGEIVYSGTPPDFTEVRRVLDGLVTIHR